MQNMLIVIQLNLLFNINQIGIFDSNTLSLSDVFLIILLVLVVVSVIVTIDAATGARISAHLLLNVVELA